MKVRLTDSKLKNFMRRVGTQEVTCRPPADSPHNRRLNELWMVAIEQVLFRQKRPK